MKNLLPPLFSIALAFVFVGCALDQPPSRRDTIFHSAEDSPRTGSQGSSRYGLNGTHSPTERKKSSSRSNRNQESNSRSNRRSNSDPDGIVKPRDLDPEPDREDPVIASNEPKLEREDPKPEPTPAPTPSGDAPYAEAVPGKVGLVYSPFVSDKSKALVNVTDENNVPLPPGTEVQCPITKKNFRVP